MLDWLTSMFVPVGSLVNGIWELLKRKHDRGEK